MEVLREPKYINMYICKKVVSLKNIIGNVLIPMMLPLFGTYLIKLNMIIYSELKIKCFKFVCVGVCMDGFLLPLIL